MKCCNIVSVFALSLISFMFQTKKSGIRVVVLQGKVLNYKISLDDNRLFQCWNLIQNVHLFFFNEQLVSNLQSCLYFQGFWGAKLLHSCLVVWPSNLCLRGVKYFSGFKTYIFGFKIFRSKNAFETTESWCIVGLAAILRLLQRKNSTFFNL